MLFVIRCMKVIVGNQLFSVARFVVLVLLMQFLFSPFKDTKILQNNIYDCSFTGILKQKTDSE